MLTERLLILNTTATPCCQNKLLMNGSLPFNVNKQKFSGVNSDSKNAVYYVIVKRSIANK